MSSKKEKLEVIAKSKLLRRSITGVYCLRSAYQSSSSDDPATEPLRQSVGWQLWLQLNDGSQVAVLCQRAAIDYGVSIKREELHFSPEDDRYCQINNQSNWDSIRGKSIFNVRYHFREYRVFVARKRQAGNREVPLALAIEFTNGQKIWIVSMEIDAAGNSRFGVDNLMIFFDRADAEKYGFLDLIEPSRQANLPVYEQFTWQGFLAVSGWAGAYTFFLLQVLFILIDVGLVEVGSVWGATLVIYGVIWSLCFLTMCLWPKLNSMH